MMSLILRVVAPLVVAVVAACAPNVAVYYRPEMVGGNTPAPVRGCTPTANGVLFRVEDVAFSLQHLSAAGQRKPGLLMLVEVPPQVRIRFGSASWELRHAPSGAPIVVHGIDVYRGDGGVQPVTEPFVGRDVSAADRARGVSARTTIVARTEDIQGEAFTLQLPPVLVNDRTHTLPLIHFQRTTWMGVSPLNC